MKPIIILRLKRLNIPIYPTRVSIITQEIEELMRITMKKIKITFIMNNNRINIARIMAISSYNWKTRITKITSLTVLLINFKRKVWSKENSRKSVVITWKLKRVRYRRRKLLWIKFLRCWVIEKYIHSKCHHQWIWISRWKKV